MKKIKLGILGTSEIAFRRFLPALHKSENFEYIGIASRSIDKTYKFIGAFGGTGFDNYDALLNDPQIDAVYIPLPPALHFEWAQKALLLGKHVLLEKPATTCYADTDQLVKLASQKGLALQENYMFIYHSQLRSFQEIISSGEIGELRQIRIAFSFPKRADNDFRYNKELGGGALLDCGGYTVKLATLVLGSSMKISASKLNYTNGSSVDLFGSATAQNDKGITAQLCFGMDNSYKCELEVIGSRGSLLTNRIFTAPPDFKPVINMNIENRHQSIVLDSDDQFFHSIEHFNNCITDENLRECGYLELLQQAKLIDQIFEIGTIKG